MVEQRSLIHVTDDPQALQRLSRPTHIQGDKGKVNRVRNRHSDWPRWEDDKRTQAVEHLGRPESLHLDRRDEHLFSVHESAGFTPGAF